MFTNCSLRFLSLFLLASLGSAADHEEFRRDASLFISWPNVTAVDAGPSFVVSTVYYCTCGPSVITASLQPSSSIATVSSDTILPAVTSSASASPGSSSNPSNPPLSSLSNPPGAAASSSATSLDISSPTNEVPSPSSSSFTFFSSDSASPSSLNYVALSTGMSELPQASDSVTIASLSEAAGAQPTSSNSFISSTITSSPTVETTSDETAAPTDTSTTPPIGNYQPSPVACASISYALLAPTNANDRPVIQTYCIPAMQTDDGAYESIPSAVATNQTTTSSIASLAAATANPASSWSNHSIALSIVTYTTQISSTASTSSLLVTSPETSSSAPSDSFSGWINPPPSDTDTTGCESSTQNSSIVNGGTLWTTNLASPTDANLSLPPDAIPSQISTSTESTNSSSLTTSTQVSSTSSTPPSRLKRFRG